MKKWMLLLLAGLGVALAGFYFAGGLFVGLLGSGEAGVDLTVGLLLFLCIISVYNPLQYPIYPCCRIRPVPVIQECKVPLPVHFYHAPAAKAQTQPFLLYKGFPHLLNHTDVFECH